MEEVKTIKFLKQERIQLDGVTYKPYKICNIPAILEHESYAEYSWDSNKIYLYTDNLDNEEDIIRSLIHESVHSNQCYEVYEAYYNECDLDYDTHPYEIEAEYEE